MIPSETPNAELIPFIERTSYSGLRSFPVAAHVKRWASVSATVRGDADV